MPEDFLFKYGGHNFVRVFDELTKFFLKYKKHISCSCCRVFDKSIFIRNDKALFFRQCSKKLSLIGVILVATGESQ